MKTTLIRKYKNDVTKVLFSLDEINMDKFTMQYENQTEMLSLFNKMEKIYTKNGVEDEGTFALITKNEDDELIEMPIYFKNDYEATLELLVLDLLNNDEYVNELITKFPEFVTKNLRSRIKVSLSGSTLPTIHDRNIRTLKNYVISSGLRDNFRRIVDITQDYLENEKEMPKVKIKEEQ